MEIKIGLFCRHQEESGIVGYRMQPISDEEGVYVCPQPQGCVGFVGLDIVNADSMFPGPK